MLASQGCEVGREFYINDALNSTQLDLFGYSVYLRYLQYQGQAIKMPDGAVDPGVPETDSAKPVADVPRKRLSGRVCEGDREGDFRGQSAINTAILWRSQYSKKWGTNITTPQMRNASNSSETPRLQRMVESQKAALAAFGLNFDTWYFESSLYEKAFSRADDCAFERARVRL